MSSNFVLFIGSGNAAFCAGISALENGSKVLIEIIGVIIVLGGLFWLKIDASKPIEIE